MSCSAFALVASTAVFCHVLTVMVAVAWKSNWSIKVKKGAESVCCFVITVTSSSMHKNSVVSYLSPQPPHITTKSPTIYTISERCISCPVVNVSIGGHELHHIGAKLHGVHFGMSTWWWVYCLKMCSLLKGVVRCIVHVFSVLSCRELFTTYMTAVTAFDPRNNWKKKTNEKLWN
jgi:hypothetical protein